MPGFYGKFVPKLVQGSETLAIRSSRRKPDSVDCKNGGHSSDKLTNGSFDVPRQTENPPQLRSFEEVMNMANQRFGKLIQKGHGRGCHHSRSLKEREGWAENFKDFWTRFARCVTRSNAHGLPLSESVVFHLAIQALRIHEGKLPILLATLGTFPNPTSVEALKSLTIKMYETHRGELDSSEVYAPNVSQAAVENDSDVEGKNNNLRMNQETYFR